MTLKSYENPGIIVQVDDPKLCRNRCSIYRNLVVSEKPENSEIDYLSTDKDDIDDFILGKVKFTYNMIEVLEMSLILVQ